MVFVPSILWIYTDAGEVSEPAPITSPPQESSPLPASEIGVATRMDRTDSSVKWSEPTICQVACAVFEESVPWQCRGEEDLPLLSWAVAVKALSKAQLRSLCFTGFTFHSYICLSIVFLVIILHCQDRPEHAERLDHLEVPSPAPLSVPSAPSAPSMPSVPVATLPAAVPMVSSMHVASSAPFTESAPAETGIRKKTRKAGSWRALKITVCHNSVWYSNFFRSFLGLVFLPLPPEALLPGHASRPQEAGSCESHLVVAGLPLPLGISFGSLSKAGVEATRPVIPVVEEFGPYPTDPTDPTQRRLVAGARASTQDWREAASGGTGHVQRLPWLTWWLSDWSFDGHFIEIHSNALGGIKATSTSWASLVGTQRAEKIDFWTLDLTWSSYLLLFRATVNPDCDTMTRPRQETFHHTLRPQPSDFQPA